MGIELSELCCKLVLVVVLALLVSDGSVFVLIFFFLLIGYLVMFCLVDMQTDLDAIDRMIDEAEATYNKWRHPDPYIGKCFCTGSKHRILL